MRTKQLRPAVREILRGYLRGGATFYLILIVIALGSVFGFSAWVVEVGDSESANLAYFGMCCAIFAFVAGVSGVREDLRLCAQLGLSRRTGMAAEALASVFIMAVFAVCNELVMAATGALAGALGKNVYAADLYQLLYLDGTPADAAVHLQSAVFSFMMMLALYFFGAFFSMMFWNLHGVGLVAGGVGIPVAVNLVAWFLGLTRLGGPLVGWLAASVWNLLAVFALWALLFGALACWLLGRAELRAAGK